MTTKNRDAGTTPFMVTCPSCNGTMYSSFYQVDQSLEATHEWYRSQTAGEWKKVGRNQEMFEHVHLGGLLLRERRTNQAVTF